MQLTTHHNFLTSCPFEREVVYTLVFHHHLSGLVSICYMPSRVTSG